MQQPKSFDLEVQYQFYLKLVALRESDMGKIQKKEMRQTFFGACGIMMALLHDEIAALDEDEAIKVLEKMNSQIHHYFLNLIHKQN